jgi:hypothetical protein
MVRKVIFWFISLVIIFILAWQLFSFLSQEAKQLTPEADVLQPVKKAKTIGQEETKRIQRQNQQLDELTER